MPNYKELTKELDKLSLQKGEYAIFGSGLLAEFGLGDAGDLDIIVTKPVFEKLQKRPDIKTIEFEGAFGKTVKLQFGEIEIFKDWAPGRWNIDKLIKNAQEVNGRFFVQKEEVIKWKTLKGREKDKEDLILLNTLC